jgi:hypothetical protein
MAVVSMQFGSRVGQVKTNSTVSLDVPQIDFRKNKRCAWRTIPVSLGIYEMTITPGMA